MVSTTLIGNQEKINILTQTSKRFGLKINISEAKTMRMMTNKDDHFRINNQNMEDVNECIYLESIISNRRGSIVDVTSRRRTKILAC